MAGLPRPDWQPDLRILAALPAEALVENAMLTRYGAGATTSLTPAQAVQVGLIWRLARRIALKYTMVMGGAPQEEEEDCTVEQPSALNKRVNTMDLPPNVDLGVWQPSGRRALRQTKFRSVVTRRRRWLHGKGAPGTNVMDPMARGLEHRSRSRPRWQQASRLPNGGMQGSS